MVSNKIEPEVRDHLSKVYSCLTVTTALSAAGAIVHSYNIWEAGFLSAFGTLAIIIGLTLTPDNGKNSHIRLGMLWGFGFLSGHTLGPLIDHVIDLNPAILVNALISTAVVFISFSISALLAKRGSFLFLGGLCLSVLTTLSLFGIANIFLQSQAIYQAHIYLGLLCMSGFILYDTQSIMEKRRNGSQDYIQHSLDLFFDLFSVFRRILIILTQKEEREQRRKRN